MSTLEAAPTVDVLVIGGGITGAGVALEAARCGVSVLLLEARDFAWGTSSRSSKMVHGGLRYLKSGAFSLTAEAVREREKLLRELPGLVDPLPFSMPIWKSAGAGRRTIGAALVLYDFMARRRTRRWADAQAMSARLPGLRAAGLQGGWSYEDAAVDDARLVLRTLQEAVALGAEVRNHTPVASLLRSESGQVCGARLANNETVNAKVVINATGVWADALRGEVGGRPMLRPLRGSHFTVPYWRLPIQEAVAFQHPRDGRHMFVYPWAGATQVGTTDLDERGSLDVEPGMTLAERDYLLEGARHVFPEHALEPADIIASWAGVRPVVAGGAGDPSKEARDAWVGDESGLITITGGKLTTFLSMARKALLAASGRIPALAEVELLAQAEPHFHTRLSAQAREQLRGLEIQCPGLSQRLAARWGASLDDLLRGTPIEDHALVPGSQHLWAELRWSLRHEQVQGLDDLLLRRTRLGMVRSDGSMDLLPRIAPMAKAELGLSNSDWDRWVDRYQSCLARGYCPEPFATAA